MGCAYKYLNGGPGAPAFLHVRKDLQEAFLPGLRGWFGSAEPFAFNLNYSPTAGMRRFLVGTPPNPFTADGGTWDQAPSGSGD
ncbi:MAG TPA: hypothetical protein VJ960_03645, partial [Oceanipulchritudo sp.]|nr:hypothetical protein [Oceanipulchritudo sp.]